MTNLVSLKDVNFIYEDKIVLDHVNLDIEKGIFMGLMGPNGGGKTTLIRIILGLLKADTGSVELFGQPIEKFKDWHKIRSEEHTSELQSRFELVCRLLLE